MKINITRKGRLERKIKDELAKQKPNLESILIAVDGYEQDNLDTIAKLRKSRVVTSNKINGALKQSIHAHGPITKVLIGSATKRILGALTVEPKAKSSKARVALLMFNIAIWGMLILYVIAQLLKIN